MLFRSEDECGRTPLWWAELLLDSFSDDQEVASIYELYRTRRLPLGAQLIGRSCLDEEGKAVVDPESTSLIKAGLAGNIQAIWHLINAGAMVNERDEKGRTLLHLITMGVVPYGYLMALELVRYGGYGVDWGALTVDGETAQELAQETLNGLDVKDDDWDEATKILCLLEDRCLPDDEDYIYPCMHAEYCEECSALSCTGHCSNTLRMPGAFD